MKKLFLFCFFYFFCLIPINAAAHGGGLDGYGCHHNRKEGSYHCHRGSLAGKTYATQAEMLEERAAPQQQNSIQRNKKRAQKRK